MSPSFQRVRLFMLVVGTAGAGCVPLYPSVTYTPMNASPRPLRRRSVDSVEVYASSPPTGPHVDVGLFEVGTSGGADPSWDALMQAARQHGALRDCDAVSIVNFGRDGRRAVPSVRAICVVYTNEEAIKAAATRPIPPQLPGEGAACDDHPSGPVGASCEAPLACTGGVCVSPYDVPKAPPAPGSGAPAPVSARTAPAPPSMSTQCRPQAGATTPLSWDSLSPCAGLPAAGASLQ